ncbi:MAG: FAD-dependent oxidoreductase, partial [Pseudomonadota bacterium]
VKTEGGVAWITVANPPVNATSTAVRAGLLRALEQVADARLAVLACAGTTFIAGGDMAEFDHPPAPPHLPDVVDAIEGSAVPVLALLHGTVLGGGFEIAMACAWRLAAPGTRFGLPEVSVGLIPGAGGTQRAPRLLGWDLAAQMVTTGRMIRADQMLDAGGIDAIVPDLNAACLAFDRPRPRPVSQRPAPPLDPAWLAKQEDTVRQAAKGQDAPHLNLTALTWATQPYATAQPRERALHLDLRQAPQARALRHAFFAERAVARPTPLTDIAPRDIRRIAVVGGGLMGTGIAMAALSAGLRVDLIEREKDAATAAQTRVAQMLDGAVARGKLAADDRAAQIDRFAVHDTLAAAADADLAIEAVFEDLATKQTVFRDLAAVLAPHAILATNTSYLDPRDIFADVPGPDRCLGLHFFSPAHVMRLVEVVPLPKTAQHVTATSFALAKRMRKVPVQSGICDGFIGNRMLAAYRRAAEYMLADGALPEQVDGAMRAFGMAMGPFEAQDMAGLQIALANRRRQDATRPATERYIPLSDQLCAAGRLGQKAGRGWYRYADGSRIPQPDHEVTVLIETYRRDKGLRPTPFDDTTIQTQLLATLADEGARIVEEGIAQDDVAVDVVKLCGYGFPRWRGGPMFAASDLGRDTIRAALDARDHASPGSWVRANRYRQP